MSEIKGEEKKNILCMQLSMSVCSEEVKNVKLALVLRTCDSSLDLLSVGLKDPYLECS